MSDKSNKQEQPPLSRQTGFWRRVSQHRHLGKTDIMCLRDDLERLETRTRELARGHGEAAALADDLGRIRETIATDYATLSLVQQTIIELLIEKGIITEDEFADKLDEIDMRDGVQDGMLRAGTGGVPPRSQAQEGAGG